MIKHDPTSHMRGWVNIDRQHFAGATLDVASHMLLIGLPKPGPPLNAFFTLAFSL